MQLPNVIIERRLPETHTLPQALLPSSSLAATFAARAQPHCPASFGAGRPPQVRQGLPVEINPSVGSGYKVMDWTEYFGRFKTSGEFPDCLACGGKNTKEHYFTQTW
jgi:hypothetical protein